MDKISGIIPANARTRTVDVSGSQPVRPGAPTWGRRVGHVTEANQNQSLANEDKVTIAGPQNELQSTATYKPSPEATKVKAIDDMAAKFFNSSIKTLAKDSDQPVSEQLTESLSEA